MIKCDYSPRSQLWIKAFVVLSCETIMRWAYTVFITGQGIKQLGSSLVLTLQVATTLVAMVHGFMFCKKSSLNQKSWLPNGNQAKKI